MQKQKIVNISASMWISSNHLNQILIKETGFSKSDLFLLSEIDDKYINKIIEDLEKLKNGYPIEYIINNAEFYSLDFYINNKVLIPRNDTEILVDIAIEEALKEENISLIDVWTGSSCIPISIMKNCSHIDNCLVIDISNEALNVSQKNINKHFWGKRIKQIHWDLLNKIIWTNDYKLNSNIIITANLPYIKNNDLKNIDIETRKYEPRLALYGWEKTWFELYEQLIKQIFLLQKLNHIKKITLIIEIWFDQKEYSHLYLENLNLQHSFFKDNNWLFRSIKICF